MTKFPTDYHNVENLKLKELSVDDTQEILNINSDNEQEKSFFTQFINQATAGLGWSTMSSDN